MSLVQQPSPAVTTAAAHDHFVQFYEGDDALIEEVSPFLLNGVRAGHAAVMIAGQPHALAIESQWAKEGLDVRAARSRGLIVTLDAEDTLARICLGGWPDPTLFEDVVGTAVRKAIAAHGGVVAFGEMVAILCARGRVPAALELERLWNELGRTHTFSLHCAYPMKLFDRADDAAQFRRICDAHSHLIPGESARGVRTERDLMRTIAGLQQQATALQHEMKMREDAEARLRERERDLADFVENAPIALHRVAADGTILWANRAELQMMGYAADEYLGRNIAEFHADGMLAAAILETLSQGRTLVEQPARLICRDGSLRHVLITSNATLRDGHFESTRCFTRDVTDRWLAQEALRERTAVLNLAMQGARMGYWVADFEAGWVSCSSEFAALVGLNGPLECTVDAFFGFAHVDDREGLREAVLRAHATQTGLVASARLRYDQGAWRACQLRGEAVYSTAERGSRFYGICLVEPIPRPG